MESQIQARTVEVIGDKSGAVKVEDAVVLAMKAPDDKSEMCNLS